MELPHIVHRECSLRDSIDIFDVLLISLEAQIGARVSHRLYDISLGGSFIDSRSVDVVCGGRGWWWLLQVFIALGVIIGLIIQLCLHKRLILLI
jgi:hypothetical protein